MSTNETQQIPSSVCKVQNWWLSYAHSAHLLIGTWISEYEQ